LIEKQDFVGWAVSAHPIYKNGTLMLRLFYMLILLLPSFSVYAEEIILDANESPPFWSKDLPHQGLGGEIIQAISQQSGLKSRINFLPLKRLRDNSKNNDLGNPLFYMANQDFSAIIPIASYRVSFFYYQPNHTKTITLDLLQNLQKYNIGVLEGTLTKHSYFAEQDISFETSYSQTSLFKKLKHGRIDLVLAIDLVAINTINQLFPEQTEKFKQLKLPNSISPIAIMIAEEQSNAENIASQYRQGLKQIIANGQYLQILKKHYYSYIPKDWLSNLERFKQLYAFDSYE